MRIKKISPTTPANGNIENQYGTSQTNAYSEEYSNNTFASKNVENYSTTETRIGTWIDGKPLYRKVIDYFPTGTIGQMSAITDILVPHNVSNIKQVVDCKMVSDSSSGAGIFPHIGTSNGQFLNKGTSIVSFDTTKLRLRIINDTWTSSHFYITIEYTKTTD